MSVTDLRNAIPGSSPGEQLAEKLADPQVVAALVTLLDHAELLSVMVQGLAGFIGRGEQIMDAVAEGALELKSAAGGAGSELPSMDELSGLLPALGDLLSSKMLKPETIATLSDIGEATTQGYTAARDGEARLSLFGLLSAMRDPQAQRGLSAAVEIAKALGRHMDESR